MQDQLRKDISDAVYAKVSGLTKERIESLIDEVMLMLNVCYDISRKQTPATPPEGIRVTYHQRPDILDEDPEQFAPGAGVF